MAKRLMVVDDDPGLSRVVELIAKRVGFAVLSVNDPRQVMEAFRAFNPNLLILDMIMPGRDGIDLLHEILTAGTSARIVLTSGFGDSFLRLARNLAKTYDKYDVAVLSKPFRRTQLERVLTDPGTD